MRRGNPIVLRGIHAGLGTDRGRWRLDRFAYGVVVGVMIGAALFGLGIIRAEEPDGPRFEPASRGNRAAVLERAEVVDLAAEVFGPELAGYVANIVRCESTYRPGADTNPPYVGLMQVDPYLHYGRVAAVVGYAVGPVAAAELLRDPRVNLATAVLIWREQGWGAWPVCSR